METKSNQDGRDKSSIIIYGPRLKFVDDMHFDVTKVYCASGERYREIVASEEFKKANHRIWRGHGSKEENKIDLGIDVGIDELVSIGSENSDENNICVTSIFGCHIGREILGKNSGVEGYNKISRAIKPHNVVIINAGKYPTLIGLNTDVIKSIQSKHDPDDIVREVVKFPQTAKILIKGSKDVVHVKLHDMKPGKNGDDGKITREKCASHIAKQALKFKIIYDLRDSDEEYEGEEIIELINNPEGVYAKYMEEMKNEVLKDDRVVENYLLASLKISFFEGKTKYLETYLSCASKKNQPENKDAIFDIKDDDLSYMMVFDSSKNKASYEILINWCLKNNPSFITQKFLPFLFEEISEKIKDRKNNNEGIGVENAIEFIKTILSSDEIYLNGGGFDSAKMLEIFYEPDDLTKKMRSIITTSFFKKISPILAKDKLSDNDRKILESINSDNLSLTDLKHRDLIDKAIDFGCHEDVLKILLKKVREPQASIVMSQIAKDNRCYEIFTNMCDKNPKDVIRFFSYSSIEGIFSVLDKEYSKNDAESVAKSIAQIFLKLIPHVENENLASFKSRSEFIASIPPLPSSPYDSSDDESDDEDREIRVGNENMVKKDEIREAVINKIIEAINLEVKKRSEEKNQSEPRSSVSGANNTSLSSDKKNVLQ